MAWSRLNLLASLLLSFAVALSPVTLAQTTAPIPVRDPQALTVLAQAMAAAGGTPAISAIQDFTGAGTITYFWGGQQVTGSVTLRGLGVGEFRLDATLPNGVRSWTVSNGSGSLQEVDGNKSEVPFQNAVNLGALSLPSLSILAALNDTSSSITSMGTTSLSGHQAFQIRLTRSLQVQDPNGIFKTLASVDYFIDSTTYQVFETQRQTHPIDTWEVGYLDEIQFGDFRTVNGLLIPFSITERIAGQETWTVQLDSITFNSGLTAATFNL